MKWFTCCFTILFIGTCYGSANNLDERVISFDGTDKVTNQNGNETDTQLLVRKIRAPQPGSSDGPPRKRQKTGPAQSSKPGIRGLVNLDGLSRFQVKHMYMDGRFGKDVSSYDELTGDPAALRKYLIELNRRMFKGNVLPAKIGNKGTFDKWVEKARKDPKIVSLVDADLSDIQKDIGEQQGFEDYLGRVQRKEQLPKDNNLFTTKGKYLITEIILKMDGDNLKVSLERYKAKLILGMDSTEVYHYDPYDTSIIEENINGNTVSYIDVESPSSSTRHETTFTREQLLQNAETTEKFWQELFEVTNVDKVGYTGPLNDQEKRFSRIELKYRREWGRVINPPTEVRPQEEVVARVPGACAKGGAAGRKKRAAGSKCALYIDSNGEVESIYPEEFMEVYEGSGEEGRRQMTNMIKNNGDKFIVNDDEAKWLEARKRLNQLVHHEELTVHAGVVETTGTVQDWRRWKKPVPSKPSEIVTEIHDAVAPRLNKIRLSGTKVTYSLAKNPHIDSIIKAGKPYGHLMLARGVINGIIHNDTTALAVIGGRVGYDIVTDVTVEVGANLFSTASKLGKSVRVLGKVAGPIGALIDVGLGAWSISKSVDRLKNADNKYDRDDAIADIVSESVDISVAVGMTVLSLAFPPAAPLIMAVGLIINIFNSIVTSMFHAGNEVERINAEIPLMGFENAHVFTSRLFDFFGLREKDYIDYLLEEKKANDVAVQSYLEFLKNNTQFMGVLFPSRALAYDGGCYLRKYYCPLGTWLGRPMCTSTDILGRGCDFNGPCANDGRSCTNEETGTEFYDCICDKSPESSFGVSHKDSYVDFRNKQYLFWERAVPGDVDGAEFKCKPSSLEFLDFRTYQRDSRLEYHCQHAIGLYRPEKEREDGQTFLVNLEDGKDEVIIDQVNDSTPYTYWLGEEGEKNFYGGNARNEFILSGDCSTGMLQGYLYGGPKDTDSLVITPTCGKGKVVQLENMEDNDRSVLKMEGALNLQLQNIENIIGRPQEAEIVSVGCSTRHVFLNGGVNASNPDYVVIGPQSCPIDVQTVLSSYTDITLDPSKGKVTIYVGEDMYGSKIELKSTVLTPEPPKPTVIFTQTNSEQVSLDEFSVGMYDATLKINNYLETEPLTVKLSTDYVSTGDRSHFQLFFNESSNTAPNTFSILMVPGNENAANEWPLRFFHNLQPHLSPKNQPIRRVGCDNIPNVFNVSAENWDILGGSKDDTFMINVPIEDAIINGGGGEDTLVVVTAQTQVIKLDDELGNLQGVQTVVKGDKAGQISIITGCDTKGIVVNGKVANSPDVVEIANCKCTSPTNLQIDAGGSTRIQLADNENQNNRVIQIFAHDTVLQPVMFELDTKGVLVPHLSVQIPLIHSRPPLSVVEEEAQSKSDGNIRRFKMTGAGLGQVVLNFKSDDDDDDEPSPFVSSPQIQLIPLTKDSPFPVQLVFQRDTMQPVIVHVLQKVKSDFGYYQVFGFDEVHNLYQIFEITQAFAICGGKLKDTFIGTSTALSFGRYDLDLESDNTLIVKEDIQKSTESTTPFKIDLERGSMGLLLNESKEQGTIESSFNHIIGRSYQPDIIVAGCTTKSIAGKGGSGELDIQQDLIVIKDMTTLCRNNDNIQTDNSSSLEVHLGPFTNVENLAKMGVFNYFIDLTKPANHIHFSLHPNQDTLHKVTFIMPAVSSLVHFESIKFNENETTLNFYAQDQSKNVELYQFQMYRQNDQSDYYSNPTFLITTEGGGGITSNVKVGGEGKIIATSLLEGECQRQREISGLPVHINNILVNLTAGNSTNCGKVLGHPTSTENHFWLYGVPADSQFQIEAPEMRENQINALHLGESFHGNKPVTVYLSPVHGYVKQHGVNGTFSSLELRNISSLVGRNYTTSYDTVIPSCFTRQVSGVDLISILLNSNEDCAYDIIIGVEPFTRVQFSWTNDSRSVDEEGGNLTEFWNSVFHYRFSEPMSFEVALSYPGMLDGTVHNYYLPFNFEELEALNFDEEESKLHYTIDSEEYYITIVTEPDDSDQFYPQPNMATKDGFRIQVGRDESLLITGVLQGVQVQHPQQLFKKFQTAANTLEVTMVIKTDFDFMHVGNNGAKSDRNVLQNLGYSQSYLGGGGAADTIYEVVKLNRNVYISTGLEDTIPAPAVNMEGQYIRKQTLDLSDIVTPIRLEVGYKYKPSVIQRGDDLVVFMEGFKNLYPGEVVIYGGAKEKVCGNLQVLLSNAMMEFVSYENSTSGENSWKLSPVEVQLERETVYSIAAEDLEHGHHVVILDLKYEPEYRFRFNYSQNGDDLQLSDIEEFSEHRYDQRHIEMTTLIITDFYKSRNTAASKQEGVVPDAPAEIRDVTVFMPGLKVKLNGTDVLLLGDESNALNTVEETNKSIISTLGTLSVSTAKVLPNPVLLSTGEIPKWTSILHQVEDSILEQIPFVHRVY